MPPSDFPKPKFGSRDVHFWKQDNTCDAGAALISEHNFAKANALTNRRRRSLQTLLSNAIGRHQSSFDKPFFRVGEQGGNTRPFNHVASNSRSSYVCVVSYLLAVRSLTMLRDASSCSRRPCFAVWILQSGFGSSFFGLWIDSLTVSSEKISEARRKNAKGVFMYIGTTATIG